MILFVCARIVSPANLRDYYCVLKRLHKCEGVDVLRQAGVHLLRSKIPPAEGGVLVLRNIRVRRRLQHSHTPIRPECAGMCNLIGTRMRPCARRLPADDSLTKRARLSTAGLSGRLVSAGYDDLVQLTTTSSLPGHLPLLIPRENGDRYGDQEPDASPVSIGRPLDTMFYA